MIDRQRAPNIPTIHSNANKEPVPNEERPSIEAVEKAILSALKGTNLPITNVGAALLIATCVDALDDVFSNIECFNPHAARALSRAKRLVALAKLAVSNQERRVGASSEPDRLVPSTLAKQVSQVTEQIERYWAPDISPSDKNLGNPGPGERLAIPLPPSPSPGADPRRPAIDCAFIPPAVGLLAGSDDDHDLQPVRSIADARLIRHIIRQRQQRSRFFESDLFADPAWDMLLDLFAAQAENRRVSVTSLCIASGVPPTTALRWIGQLTEVGLTQRQDDEADRRRAFITLTDKAIDSMTRFFDYLGAPPIFMV